MDVIYRSRFITAAALAWLSACGGTPHTLDPASPTGVPARPGIEAANAPRAGQPDPDLNRPPPRKLLSIDWATAPLGTDAEALAVWAQIAPNGEDWLEKLDEVPAQATRPLAMAMLRSGSFGSCGTPVHADCAPPVPQVPEPAHAADANDPCLRRLLALWSIAQLEVEDRVRLKDVFRALAAIPPPESQLVAVALRALPEADNAGRLELIAVAAAAGQLELANAASGRLDEPFLIEAATKHHFEGALEVLSATGHRPVYLAAVVDEAMPGGARQKAIAELAAVDPDAPLAPDLKAALVRATASKDCTVAAVAARTLEQRGDRAYVPSRARARTPAAMMRALCVLASYEPLQAAGEPSLLPGFVPPKGLERGIIEYDALSDTDLDGDGDPHTRRSLELVPRAELVVPEAEDLARAMKRCTGTVCTSQDREFRFTIKPVNGALSLTRIEIIERPPC